VQLRNGTDSSYIASPYFNGNGSFTYNFTGADGGFILIFNTAGATNTGTVDNVSVIDMTPSTSRAGEPTGLLLALTEAS
jgi:hypothetical protein